VEWQWVGVDVSTGGAAEAGREDGKLMKTEVSLVVDPMVYSF
jgi:hypothetical protein